MEVQASHVFSSDTAKVDMGACYQPAGWKSWLPTWPALTLTWLGGWAFSLWPYLHKAPDLALSSVGGGGTMVFSVVFGYGRVVIVKSFVFLRLLLSCSFG